MANAEVTQQVLHDGLQALYRELDKAYWDATTMETKDRIRGIAEAVLDVMSELNRRAIAQRTNEFAEMRETIIKVNDKLTELKADLDKIIHNIKTAGEVAGAIDKALGLAASFFTL